MPQLSYARHRFPPANTQRAVWRYFRFALSYCVDEDRRMPSPNGSSRFANPNGFSTSSARVSHFWRWCEVDSVKCWIFGVSRVVIWVIGGGDWGKPGGDRKIWC